MLNKRGLSDQPRTLRVVRLLAAAIFSGLALVAGSVLIFTFETRQPDDPYSHAEEIVTAALDAGGIRFSSVERFLGPYVKVKRPDGDCLLVDVSTPDTRNDGTDFFWIVGPTEPRKSRDC